MNKRKLEVSFLVVVFAFVSLNLGASTTAKAGTQGDKYLHEVVVVSKSAPPDMMSAYTLSNVLGTEIIVFDKTKGLDSKVGDYDNLILVGGDNVLDGKYFEKYRNIRLSGKDRYKTSLETLRYIIKRKKLHEINIVSGDSYADVAVTACDNVMTVITDNNLSSENSIALKELIEKNKIDNVRVVGGGVNVSENTMKFFNAIRVFGRDRYGTSVEYAKLTNKKAKEVTFKNFVENIAKSKEAFDNSENIVFLKPSKDSIVVSLQGIRNDIRKETDEFVFNDNTDMNNLFMKVVKDAESGKFKKELPSQIAYPIRIKYNDILLFLLVDDLKTKDDNIRIMIKKGGKTREYTANKSNDIEKLLNIIDEETNKLIPR